MLSDDGSPAGQMREIYEAQMLEVYSSAAKLAIARANALSKAPGEISLSYANFIAVFSDTGTGLPVKNPSAGPLGGSAIGMSSTSKNLVPAGKSEAVTIKGRQDSASLQ